MPDSPIISVSHVRKTYRIWDRPSARLTAPLLESTARLLSHSSKARTWLQAKSAAAYHDFHALDDISFEVAKGESIGIIGRNGSGKSTLLQIIAGTLQPTGGISKVHGRVAALLELGSGFNPEFTGRENVFLTGAVMGFSNREIHRRFAEIEAFAEIGDFIEQPVKTYSSGMMVRLAFAVQTAIDPDILIVDEALSVGDFFFQQKCATRMRALKETGTTLLFVSHDMGSVRDLCERALYLRKGKTVLFDDSQKVISAYYAEDSPAPSRATQAIPSQHLQEPSPNDFKAKALWWRSEDQKASGSASLLGIALLDMSGLPVTHLKIGQHLRVQALLRTHKEGGYHFAIELKNRYDHVVTSISSYTCGLDAVQLDAGQSIIVEIGIKMDFESGRYSLQGVLAGEVTEPNRATRHDASPWFGPIDINWDYDTQRAPFLGMFGPEATAKYIHHHEAN